MKPPCLGLRLERCNDSAFCSLALLHIQPRRRCLGRILLIRPTVGLARHLLSVDPATLRNRAVPNPSPGDDSLVDSWTKPTDSTSTVTRGVLAAHLTCCFFLDVGNDGEGIRILLSTPPSRFKVRVSLTLNPPQPGNRMETAVRVGPRPAMS